MSRQPFQLKTVIVSSEPDAWTTDELEFIHRVFSQMEDCEVSPIAVMSSGFFMGDSTPPTYIASKDGKKRFLHSWFERIFTKPITAQFDYNLIIWHMNRQQRTAYGVTDFVGGYWTDTNEYLEAWIAADRDEPATKSKTIYAIDPKDGKKRKLNQRLRLVFHEGGHAVTHFSGRRKELARKFGLDEADLITHYLDYEAKDVTRVFVEASFKKWSYYEYAKSLLIQIITSLTASKTTPSEPVKEEEQTEHSQPSDSSLLYKMARGIQEFEDYVLPGDKYRDGSVAPQGSLSYRHRNPGNLRWSPFEVSNKNNFSVFATYEEGWKALMHQLQIAADGRSSAYTPEMSILNFFEVYAPSSDNNYPSVYAQYVADSMGVPVETKLKELI